MSYEVKKRPEEFESFIPAVLPRDTESNDAEWQRTGGDQGVEDTAADIPADNAASTPRAWENTPAKPAGYGDAPQEADEQ